MHDQVAQGCYISTLPNGSCDMVQNGSYPDQWHVMLPKQFEQSHHSHHQPQVPDSLKCQINAAYNPRVLLSREGLADRPQHTCKPSFKKLANLSDKTHTCQV